MSRILFFLFLCKEKSKNAVLFEILIISPKSILRKRFIEINLKNACFQTFHLNYKLFNEIIAFLIDFIL